MKLFLSLFVFVSTMFGYGFPEEYYKINSAKKQKKEFVNVLEPLVENANKVVLREREFVKNFFTKTLARNFRNFEKNDLAMLIKLAKKYRIKKLFYKQAYFKKINTVPISLALTQGAIESGWGKSRFVREANNIFGHWTWGKVGLVPLDRDEEKTHRIRIFKSLQSSVNAYILNLNRNNAYKEFRELRYKAWKKKEPFGGLKAASTMVNYSELDEHYIKMLQNIMKSNGFLKYDK